MKKKKKKKKMKKICKREHGVEMEQGNNNRTIKVNCECQYCTHKQGDKCEYNTD